MMIITDKVRSASAGIPVACTRVAKNRVKREKLRTKPVTTPNGRLCPPVRPEDKTIGKIGSIQGERMVTKPAMKAKKARISISN